MIKSQRVHLPTIQRTVWLSVFTAWLLWGCGGGGAPENAGPGAAPVKVEGFLVQPQEISSVIQSSGTLIPAEETVLYPEVSGRVVGVFIPEGKRISKGTLLVKLFDGDLQAQLKKLEAQGKLASQTEKRIGELSSVNGVSQQEYDQALLQLNLLESEMDIVKVQIAKTEIRAPYDGTVGLKQVSEGAFISPQTAVCTIRTSHRLKLDFSIPEKYGSMISEGTKVSFQLAGDTSEYIATVEATEQSVEKESRNLRIRAAVAPSPGQLMPGAFAEVKVPLSSRQNALLIPSQAIIPQARNKLVIVNRGGKATFVPITTGVRQESLVEVTGGLAIGDTIAITGIMFLRPGAPIEFSAIR